MSRDEAEKDTLPGRSCIRHLSKETDYLVGAPIRLNKNGRGQKIRHPDA